MFMLLRPMPKMEIAARRTGLFLGSERALKIINISLSLHTRESYLESHSQLHHENTDFLSEFRH